MSDLRKRYQEILKDLEEHIQDEEQKAFVIEKFQELSIVFMDIIDRLTYITDIRVKEVEEKQKEIENKISSVQKTVDGIENDIYEEEELYDFEIVCPYCNHEFVADINSDVNTEVECPECHNIIELDWNGDDEECELQGCSHCNQGCMGSTELIYDNEELEEDEETTNKKQEDYDEKENDEEDM